MKQLVLALDSFGDLVLRQPLLSGLLDDGNEVGVVVRCGFERVLPLLDPRLVAHAVPFRYAERPGLEETRATLDRLAALEPDLVVDAQFDRVRYAEWIRRRLAPVRAAGFEGGTPQDVAGAQALELDLRLPPSRPLDVRVRCEVQLPEVEKNAKLLESLVGHPPASGPRLALPEALLERGRDRLSALGLHPGEYVVCCPAGTANVALKAWPAERFARLVSWLARERHLPVLVVGHESEAAAVDAAIGLVEGARRFLGGDDEFELLAALLAHARLYLGNDTGPMHLAAAAGVPVVAVFGGGHWPRFLPCSETGAAHTQDLPCFGCGWRDCVFGDAPCVGRVSESRVRESVARVLDGGRGFEVVRQPATAGDAIPPRALAGFRALSGEAARRLDGLVARDGEIEGLRQTIRKHDDALRGLQAEIARLDRAARHAPLVSIVTPTRNAARWLERCILSVRDQDYPRLEHIVVDGGSTDATLEICARHPHLVVHSAPDRGQSDALNRGFAMARGDILAWLCSDDEYLPGAVSIAVDTVLSGSDFVVGNCQFIDAEGRRVVAHPANLHSRIDHHAVLRFWELTIPQPAAFWHHRLWERCGPLREDLHFAMDYDLWLRMTKVAAVERVGVDMASYRIHPAAKCFADNYGSRLELLQVSRSHWPPPWRPGHWRLALEHWLSARDITPHYTEAERLRDRAFRSLEQGRRLRALMAFARMHALHPRSAALPDYGRLARKLAASFVPALLVPLAQAALRLRRKGERVAA